MQYKLTVIIRDDAPMVYCGDCPSYRTVVLPLTAEQCEMVKLRITATAGEMTYREQISTTILEEDHNESNP